MGFFSGIGKAFKGVAGGLGSFFKKGFQLNKRLFIDTPANIFKSVAGLLQPQVVIPEMPQSVIIQEPPKIAEEQPPASKEGSAAAKEEQRRALARYGRTTRTLLSGFSMAAAKKLLGE